MMEYAMRPVRPSDNPALHRIILSVVREHGIEESDYLADDAELKDLYSQYRGGKSYYWVVEQKATGRVVGGGGYAPLPGGAPEDGVCEVQKMYFLPECRGRGLGKALLARVIEQARAQGFALLYAETHPRLTQAVALYRRFGFDRVDKKLGHTGHAACSVFMVRSLTESDA